MKFFIKIFIAGMCSSFSLSIAGPNDISQAPLSFLAVSQAKPNIFFILDDSGSMQSSALGDEVTVVVCATRPSTTQRLFIQCQSSLTAHIFLNSNSHKRFITVLTQPVSR
jgi:hypothetical protein